ncbi:hypothetical protein EB061_02110 [bacterium]|nr:hypothetical protein [bacterium]
MATPTRGNSVFSGQARARSSISTAAPSPMFGSTKRCPVFASKGSGNLSRPMASRFAEVFCVDLFTGLVDAEAPGNFHPVRQDMARWARTPFEDSLAGRQASIILDPPREGIGETLPPLLEKLSGLSISSMILVGCDVDAFTRDVHRLLKKGFQLERLGVLDLFPQTPHIESLALFSGSALH